MIVRGIAIKIPMVTNKVLLILLGLRNPKSFHEILRTFILQVATTNVETDQKSPFSINPNFGKYISRMKNITEM